MFGDTSEYTATRRRVIKTLGLGGATILGAAATGTVTAAKDTTPGTVTVTSDNGKWGYDVIMINKSGQKDIKEGDNLEPGDGVGPIGSAGVGTVTEYDEDTYIFDDQPYRILVDKPDGDGFLRVTTESDPYGFSVQCWDGTFDYEVTTNVEISFDDDGDPVYGNTVSGTVNEDESSPHGYITEPSEAPRLSTVKFSEPNSSSGFTMQFYPD